MRPLWSLKRLIKRYGYHPAKAIYREQLRRRYIRLGRWLAKRYEQKPPLLLPPPVPMPKIPPMEEWPEPPDWVSMLLPHQPEPQVLHWPTGAWRDFYLAEHPHLRKPALEQHTDPIALDKIPTIRINDDDTIKARGIMRERLKTGEQ